MDGRCRARWAWVLRGLLFGMLAGSVLSQAAPAPGSDAIVELRQAELVLTTEDDHPPSSASAWQATALPAYVGHAEAWFRVSFTLPNVAEPQSLYLPYLYGGGSVWLNGQQVAEVNRSAPGLRVRWERPHLLLLPPEALRVGPNELLIRASAAHYPPKTVLPRLSIGPTLALQTPFERRLFLVRSLPMIAIALCSAGGALALYVWWRRRSELEYGYFGAAALSWAMRSTTFTIDTWRDDLWDAWRLLYYVGTGGLVVCLCLLALTMAGWIRPGMRRALLAYWAAGPLVYLVGTDRLTDWFWVSGLLPIGLLALVAGMTAAWRSRSRSHLAMAASLLLAFVAGAHDLLMSRDSPWLLQALPDWTAHRFFLLHHAANAMLAVMGLTLAQRFVRSLGEVEQARATLEARVREREAEIKASYARISALEASRAAADERQRIMQELHDGLGSQLFAGLAQAERGQLTGERMAELLRDSITEMRLALDTLTAGEEDFQAVFGNFRYRWESRLREFGVNGQWRFELPDEVPPVDARTTLQLLRIAQEALTNVIKHAQAQTVQVRLGLRDGVLSLCVQDDGRGPSGPGGAGGGQGLRNMAARALSLGGALTVGAAEPQGTRVAVSLPLQRPEAGSA